MPKQRSVIAPKKTGECPCHYVVGNIIPTATNDTKEAVFKGYFCFLFRTEPLSKGSAENISSTTAKQEDVKAIGEDSRICKWEERSARAV